MKRCMYCGHENEDTAENCVKCGNLLLDVPGDDSAPLEEVPDELGPEPVPTEDIPEINIPDMEPHAQADRGENTEEPQNAGAAPAQGADGAAADAEQPGGGPSTVDVNRGGTYAAMQQEQGEEEGAPQYGGQDYGYEAQEGGQPDYGGQGYGYHGEQGQAQGDGAYEDEEEYYEPGPVQVKSRKRVKSFLFFLAALCYTVRTGALIANAVTGNGMVTLKALSSNIRLFLGENMITNGLAGGVTQLEKMTAGKDLMVRLGSLGGCIPAVLITLGLWMAFISTTNKKEENSTAGLTLIRVIEILKMIAACIVLAGGIVISVAFVVAAGASSSTMSLILGILALLVVVIVAVFTILYYVQLIFSIRSVRRSVRNGDFIGKIPGFLIFIGLFLTALTGACMVPMAPDDYLGLILLGATAAWLLFISIWAIVYRATVKAR